jgi:hypothetical protein
MGLISICQPLSSVMILGRHTFASSNVSLNVFSDSPDIPETIEGAETLIKGS